MSTIVEINTEALPDSGQSDAQNEAVSKGSGETVFDDSAKEEHNVQEALAEAQKDAGAGEKAPDSGAAESGNAPSEADLYEKIADLEAKLAESGDQLLRKAADFENFRKRMNQEKQGAIEFANQTLLLDIIPIIDDFERAIQSAQATEELVALPAGKALLDGISMIENRLISQLENKWGLKRFNAAGEIFDPNFHEAMFVEKSPDVAEATVQEDFIKGYTLKDRVIRAAKVKVLVPGERE